MLEIFLNLFGYSSNIKLEYESQMHEEYNMTSW